MEMADSSKPASGRRHGGDNMLHNPVYPVSSTNSDVEEYSESDASLSSENDFDEYARWGSVGSDEESDTDEE